MHRHIHVCRQTNTCMCVSLKVDIYEFAILITIPVHCIVLYCIVSIHLYSASYSAHESEALPVLENQREESSITSSHITFSVQLSGNSVFNYLLTLIFYFSFHLLINQEVVSQQTTWSDRV